MARAVLVTLVLAAGIAPAQAAPEPDPLAMVAEAERLAAGPDAERAVLLLWGALAALDQRPGSAADAAVAEGALALLGTCDPWHAERTAALKAFARAQVDLAMVYRGKKWFAAAARCLDLADRFDRTAGAKERAQLAAGSPSASPPEPAAPSFLRVAATARQHGPWREVGDLLECGAHPERTAWYEWIVDQVHEDCELSLEFRASDAKQSHDCALLVGVDGAGTFHQLIAAYHAEDGRYGLTLFAWSSDPVRRVAEATVAPLPTADGFHRLTVRVVGNALRAQLDDTPPLEAKLDAPSRGRFGITVGLVDQASVPITFRNFRCGPWPPPSDEEVRTRAELATHKRVAAAIERAQVDILMKAPESATVTLWLAHREAAALSSAVLRTTLLKSIDAQLTKADLLHSRRVKVAQEGVRALVALADRHAAAGRPSIAERLVLRAAEIDPAACTARLAAAREAVRARGNTADK